MDTKTIRIRIDGEHYEDVILTEMTWPQEWQAIKEAKKSVLNPATLKKEESLDEELLRRLRFIASVKQSNSPITLKTFDTLPRRDMFTFMQAFEQLNDIPSDHKSSSQEDDSGAATS